MSEEAECGVSRWFHCWGCERDVEDPYAEVHDGKLRGECECGARLIKEARR